MSYQYPVFWTTSLIIASICIKLIFKGIMHILPSGIWLSTGKMCCDQPTKARMWPRRLPSIHLCACIISYPLTGMRKTIPKNLILGKISIKLWELPSQTRASYLPLLLSLQDLSNAHVHLLSVSCCQKIILLVLNFFLVKSSYKLQVQWASQFTSFQLIISPSPSQFKLNKNGPSQVTNIWLDSHKFWSFMEKKLFCAILFQGGHY